MFADLTKLPDPTTPEDLVTVAESNYPIFTSWVLVNTKIGKRSSVFRENLRFSLEYLNGLEKTDAVKRDISSITKLKDKTQFCSHLINDEEIIPLILNSTCWSDDSKGYVELPRKFIVIDSELQTGILKGFYKEAEGRKWTSEPKPIEQFQTWYPWLVQKNYFARLFLPVIASWYESGLSGYWDRVADPDWGIRDMKPYLLGIKEHFGKGDDHQKFKKVSNDAMLPVYKVCIWLCFMTVVGFGGEIVVKKFKKLNN